MAATHDQMPDDDDALMLALQAGDGDAFARLVDRHEGALLGFFVRHLRDHQLAEDLTQETLLRVFKESWDYLPRGTFRGWMFRIARNLLIDSTRRRSNDAILRAGRSRGNEDDDGLSQVEGDARTPVDLAEHHEVVQVVDDSLPLIPEDQRLTFVLYHFAGLTLPEVADAMESNLPTTKSRLRLAREKLRESLKRRGIQDPWGQEHEGDGVDD